MALDLRCVIRYDADGSPVEVRLIDWQIMYVKSIGSDLNNFIYSSVKGDMLQHRDHLLRSYSSCLNALLQKGQAKEIPFDDLFAEFLSHNPVGVNYAVVNTFMNPVAPEDVPQVEEGAETYEDFSTQCFHTYKRIFEKDERQRQTFFGIFKEFRALGLYESKK